MAESLGPLWPCDDELFKLLRLDARFGLDFALPASSALPLILVGVIFRCVGLANMSPALLLRRIAVISSAGNTSPSDISELVSFEWRRLCCENTSSEYLRILNGKSILLYRKYIETRHQTYCFSKSVHFRSKYIRKSSISRL